jgi:hypothetical protein
LGLKLVEEEVKQVVGNSWLFSSELLQQIVFHFQFILYQANQESALKGGGEVLMGYRDGISVEK